MDLGIETLGLMIGPVENFSFANLRSLHRAAHKLNLVRLLKPNVGHLCILLTLVGT